MGRWTRRMRISLRTPSSRVTQRNDHTHGHEVQAGPEAAPSSSDRKRTQSRKLSKKDLFSAAPRLFVGLRGERADATEYISLAGEGSPNRLNDRPSRGRLARIRIPWSAR